MKEGLTLVSGGTDNHMMLVDLTHLNITGKEAEAVLGQAGITVNKNSIPFETRSPFVTSGIRIGTPAVTTRGMGEAEMVTIARLIVDTLKNHQENKVIADVRAKVRELCDAFALYQNWDKGATA